MSVTAQVYIEGWNACFAGEDGRFTNPYPRRSETAYTWDHGFLDAMEAEDGDEPEPECAGYGTGSFSTVTVLSSSS